MAGSGQKWQEVVGVALTSGRLRGDAQVAAKSPCRHAKGVPIINDAPPVRRAARRSRGGAASCALVPRELSVSPLFVRFSKITVSMSNLGV
jgi:hypothetical protein